MISKREATGLGVLGILSIIVAGAVVIGLSIMYVFGVGFFTDATADRQGETQKKQQVEGNGAYRIAAYDKFFDDCASIQSTEGQIKIQKQQLASTTDAGQRSIITTNVTALESIRVSAISQYNADARKSYTSGQFRSSDLPYRIDPSSDMETSCTA